MRCVRLKHLNSLCLESTEGCAVGAGLWPWGGKPWTAPADLGVQETLGCMEIRALRCLLGTKELCLAGSVVWVLGDSTLSTSLPSLLTVVAAWGLRGFFLWDCTVPLHSLCGCFTTDGNGSERHLSCEMMGTEMASSPNPLPQGSSPFPGIPTP